MALSYIIVVAFIVGVIAVEFAPKNHRDSPEAQVRFGMAVGAAFFVAVLAMNGLAAAIR